MGISAKCMSGLVGMGCSEYGGAYSHCMTDLTMCYPYSGCGTVGFAAPANTFANPATWRYVTDSGCGAGTVRNYINCR